MESKNIMIVGVGGQGSLLASRVLGNAALNAGFDVKISEVHGMSQRGGSVVTYVKYGAGVSSPVICRGEADIIIAFELLEAFRWLEYLKIGGQVITSTQKISPMPVITGAAEYNDDIVNKIRKKNINIVTVDAMKLAKEAGSDKASNVVLIGMMSKIFDMKAEKITKQDYLASLEKSVNPKIFDLNFKAFTLGYECV